MVVDLSTLRYRNDDKAARSTKHHAPAGAFEAMIMKKTTLLATIGAAALLSVACATAKPAETAPAAEAAPAADAAAAPVEGAAKAPEGSCGAAPKN